MPSPEIYFCCLKDVKNNLLSTVLEAAIIHGNIITIRSCLACACLLEQNFCLLNQGPALQKQLYPAAATLPPKHGSAHGCEQHG